MREKYAIEKSSFEDMQALPAVHTSHHSQCPTHHHRDESGKRSRGDSEAYDQGSPTRRRAFHLLRPRELIQAHAYSGVCISLSKLAVILEEGISSKCFSPLRPHMPAIGARRHTLDPDDHYHEDLRSCIRGHWIFVDTL